MNLSNNLAATFLHSIHSHERHSDVSVIRAEDGCLAAHGEDVLGARGHGINCAALALGSQLAPAPGRRRLGAGLLLHRIRVLKPPARTLS